jgi:hypothetical protein
LRSGRGAEPWAPASSVRSLSRITVSGKQEIQDIRKPGDCRSREEGTSGISQREGLGRETVCGASSRWRVRNANAGIIRRPRISGPPRTNWSLRNIAASAGSIRFIRKQNKIRWRIEVRGRRQKMGSSRVFCLERSSPPTSNSFFREASSSNG